MTIAVDPRKRGHRRPTSLCSTWHHLYETEDALTRHLPAAHRDVRVVAGPLDMAFYASENDEVVGGPDHPFEAFDQPGRRRGRWQLVRGP